MLPNWEEDLKRCHEVHKMPGLRVHPNYHDYKLDDPKFLKLLELADQRCLILQIAVSMEDRRTQHPLVQVPEVDVSPLISVLWNFPRLKVVLLNSFRTVKAALVTHLANAGLVHFEISTLEGVGGISNLIKQIPV